MGQIASGEREIYQDIWQHDEYSNHSPGAEMVPYFLDMACIPPWRLWRRGTVLDAGCGAGQGMIALTERGFTVSGVDLCDVRLPEVQTFPFTEVTLWDRQLRDKVGMHDYLYCCDVLEHVPLELTMLVLANLMSCARVGLFLNISLMEDRFGAFVGRPLHLSVCPFTWWRDHLKEFGTVIECRDQINSGLFYVVPA